MAGQVLLANKRSFLSPNAKLIQLRLNAGPALRGRADSRQLKGLHQKKNYARTSWS